MQVNFTGFINTKAYSYQLEDGRNTPIIQSHEINTDLLEEDFYKFLSANINCEQDFFHKSQGSRCLSVKMNKFPDLPNPEELDVYVNEKPLKFSGKNYPMFEFLNRFFCKMSRTPEDLFYIENSYTEGPYYKAFWKNHPYQPSNMLDFLNAEATIFNPKVARNLAYQFWVIFTENIRAFHAK